MLKNVMTATALLLGLSACGMHAIDEYAEIEPNETAFLIALEGDTLNNQSKLQSVEFLEKNRISAKRILIPHKLVNLCPSCMTAAYKDVPTARLIKINRAPVTREWTRDPGTGTNSSNQSISVETNESIDFDIGATISTHVTEESAAKFLYYYAGKQLAEVTDTNIRSSLASILSRQFGSHELDWGRTHKSEVFDIARKEIREFYGLRGIAIDNLGFVEGMTYHDKRIQEAINKKFEADVQVSAATQQLKAARILAEAGAAVQAQQDLEMRKRELDIRADAVKKWDGHMPSVVSGDGKLIFGIPTSIGQK